MVPLMQLLVFHEDARLATDSCNLKSTENGLCQLISIIFLSRWVRNYRDSQTQTVLQATQKYLNLTILLFCAITPGFCWKLILQHELIWLLNMFLSKLYVLRTSQEEDRDFTKNVKRLVFSNVQELFFTRKIQMISFSAYLYSQKTHENCQQFFSAIIQSTKELIRKKEI